MSKRDTFQIVYNSAYGGFGISIECQKEYTRLTGKAYPARDDPVFVQLVQQMGVEADGPYCSLDIQEFPMEYKSFLRIDEYDGKETVSIDYDKYLIYHIKEHIMDSSLTDAQRIERIRGLYNEYTVSLKMDKDMFD